MSKKGWLHRQLQNAADAVESLPPWMRQDVSNERDREMIEQEESLADLRALFSHFCPREKLGSRPIVCTPVGGAYGHVAFWMIVVEGSPPRCAILLECGPHRPYRDDVFCIRTESRRVGDAQARTVRKFQKAFLTETMIDKAAVITIPGVIP